MSETGTVMCLPHITSYCVRHYDMYKGEYFPSQQVTDIESANPKHAALNRINCSSSLGKIWISFYSIFWGMLLDRSVTIFLGAKGTQQGLLRPMNWSCELVRHFLNCLSVRCGGSNTVKKFPDLGHQTRRLPA